MRIAAWRAIGTVGCAWSDPLDVGAVSISLTIPLKEPDAARTGLSVWPLKVYGAIARTEHRNCYFNCSNIQRIAPQHPRLPMPRYAGATTLASILYLQPASRG